MGIHGPPAFFSAGIPPATAARFEGTVMGARWNWDGFVPTIAMLQATKLGQVA